MFCFCDLSGRCSPRAKPTPEVWIRYLSVLAFRRLAVRTGPVWDWISFKASEAGRLLELLMLSSPPPCFLFRSRSGGLHVLRSAQDIGHMLFVRVKPDVVESEDHG